MVPSMMKTFITILFSILSFSAFCQCDCIPFREDALVRLDGTVTNISGSYYLVDNSGNGRNFLITGYDFSYLPNNYKGFPYKSLATISAPAGDATLIAADINNFLYSSGGTPNAIPVTALPLEPLFNEVTPKVVEWRRYFHEHPEYGFYQCEFSDVFAFVLTDLSTGISSNLAVIPGTNTPVSVTTIRNSIFNDPSSPNNNCASINANFFDEYNVGNPPRLNTHHRPIVN